MRDVPENELFSAYLDGELSAAEQAHVEELLARSPRARQLLEELRTLSSTLQGLPPHKLDEDLSEPVLRLAERRALAERPGSRPPAPAAPPTSAPPSPNEPSRLRRMFSPRALSWSILAVAVALLIMVFDPARRAQDDQPDRDVARAPEAPAEAAPDRGEELAVGAADKAAGRAPADDEAGHGEPFEVAGRKRVIVAKSPAGPSVAGAGEPTAEESGPGNAATGAPLMREGLAPRPDVSAGAVRGADRSVAPAEEVAKVREPDHGAPPSPEMPASPLKSAPAESHPVAAGGHRRGIGKVQGQGSGGGGLAFRPGRAGGAGTAGQGAGAAPQADAARRGAHDLVRKSGAESTPDHTVLLVHCDVSPGAARNHVFDRLLVENGIRWRQAKSEARAGEREIGPGLLPETQKKQEHEEPRQQRRLAEQADGQAGGGPVELVYVEASLAQIESTLASLSSRPEEFLTVSVKPAPGMPWQKGFSYRYNRERGFKRPSPDETTPAGPEPAPSQSKAGIDSTEGGGAGADGFAAQQTVRSRSEPESAPVQMERSGPARTQQTAEAKQVEEPGPTTPQRSFAEGAGAAALRVAEPHGRAQRLSLPGGGQTADGLAPHLKSRTAQTAEAAEQVAMPAEPGENARGQPSSKVGAAQPQGPSEAAAQPQGFGRPPVEKGRGGPGVYRVLFVLRVIPPGNLARQAVGGGASADDAAAAAVPPAAEAPAPAAPPARPAAAGAPSP